MAPPVVVSEPAPDRVSPPIHFRGFRDPFLVPEAMLALLQPIEPFVPASDPAEPLDMPVVVAARPPVAPMVTQVLRELPPVKKPQPNVVVWAATRGGDFQTP